MNTTVRLIWILLLADVNLKISSSNTLSPHPLHWWQNIYFWSKGLWVIIVAALFLLLSEKPIHVKISVNGGLHLQQRNENTVEKRGKSRENDVLHNRISYDKVKTQLGEVALSIIRGDLSQIKEKSDKSVDTTSRERSIKSSINLIYNRVNKCGSSTMLSLIEHLGNLVVSAEAINSWKHISSEDSSCRVQK